MAFVSQEQVNTSRGTGDDTIPEVELTRDVVLDGVNTIVSILAVLGNGLVIVVMLVRRREFSSFTNRLILHQSVIDAIAGPVFLGHKLGRSPGMFESVQYTLLNDISCRFLASESLMWTMNVVSTYNLLSISIERFMATCHPVRHRNTWSNARIRCNVLAVWLIGIAIGFSLLFLFEIIDGRCTSANVTTGARLLSNVAILLSSFIVPSVCLVYTYTRILLAIAKKAGSDGGDRYVNNMRQAKRNILVTTLLISGMFIVCWTPVEILFVYSRVTNQPATFSPWYIPCTTVMACNMFVNPIIYCFKYERFRVQLKKLVRGFGQNRVQALGSA